MTEYEDAFATGIQDTPNDFKVPAVTATVGADGVDRGAPTMEIVKLLVVLVAPLASVTLAVMAWLPTALGVPLITPVDAFRDKPLGSVPETMANDVGDAPPDALRESEYGELNVPDKPELGVVIDKAGDTVKFLDSWGAAL